MSAKRRRQARRHPAAPVPPTQTHRSWRGAYAAIAAVVVVLAAFALWRMQRVDASGPPLPLPRPRAARPADSIASADFIGSERCADCHRDQYRAWQSSTHAVAGGVPGHVPVVAPFSGAAIRFRDAVVVPKAEGGRYSFLVRQPGRADRTLDVDAVVGAGRMAGGGTQGFVSRVEDGTYRLLPFDFSVSSAVWFCNTTGRANHAWVAITPSLSLADCVDWPPTRILGDEPRFNNCQSCHGSQIRVALDTATGTYRTAFTALAIGCESCHGPGRGHVALVADPVAVARGDVGMRPLSVAGKDASLGVCWSCHSLKDRLRPGFVAGDPLDAFYSVRLPQLGDAPLLPDGRVRTFAYQEGHLYSDCYVNGGMTCTSCHDPHSQGYRDVTGESLRGRFDDRQCTSCHASKADPASRHTKHRTGSPGSACVSCHMPYLQEPEVGTGVRYTRADHSIAIPRPAFDSTLGLTNACKGCHAERSVAALDAQTRAWWGEIKPHPRAVDALLQAQATDSRSAAARLLLAPDERHTAALFAGLTYFLDRFLEPDASPLEPEVVSSLEALTRHADDDVRALALASLHYAGGRAVRPFLAEALRAVAPGATEWNVRARWSVTLGYLADKLRGQGRSAAAIDTYSKALEIVPDEPRTLANLALAYVDAGNTSAAEASYRRSLAIDPVQPLTLVNFGISLAGHGDFTGAIGAYRRALALNPREPLASFNLANAFLQQGNADSAAPHYARAAALDPSLSLAHFYLGRIQAQRGDLARALREVDLGLEFDSANADALAMRAELVRQLNKRR